MKTNKIPIYIIIVLTALNVWQTIRVDSLRQSLQEAREAHLKTLEEHVEFNKYIMEKMKQRGMLPRE